MSANLMKLQQVITGVHASAQHKMPAYTVFSVWFSRFF